MEKLNELIGLIRHQVTEAGCNLPFLDDAVAKVIHERDAARVDADDYKKAEQFAMLQLSRTTAERDAAIKRAQEAEAQVAVLAGCLDQAMHLIGDVAPDSSVLETLAPRVEAALSSLPERARQVLDGGGRDVPKEPIDESARLEITRLERGNMDLADEVAALKAERDGWVDKYDRMLDAADAAARDLAADLAAEREKVERLTGK